MSDRMFERNATGMEGDGAIFVATRSAILEVALDGTTNIGQLATDLMVTIQQPLT